MCVRNASADDVDFYGNAPSSCFPGDAEMDLVDPTTGAPRGAVRMDEARVGDAVRCLVPSNVAAGDARDGAQAYAPGVCRVFGYLDADKVGWGGRLRGTPRAAFERRSKALLQSRRRPSPWLPLHAQRSPTSRAARPPLRLHR